MFCSVKCLSLYKYKFLSFLHSSQHSLSITLYMLIMEKASGFLMQQSEKCSDIFPDPPRSPTTVVSPGDVVEGISMTLTCSSEAKPAVHTYTWYWKSGAHSSKLRVGQNYSIPNVTCGHSGEYHCQAENLKGSTNSTPVFVDVLCK